MPKSIDELRLELQKDVATARCRRRVVLPDVGCYTGDCGDSICLLGAVMEARGAADRYDEGDMGGNAHEIVSELLGITPREAYQLESGFECWPHRREADTESPFYQLGKEFREEAVREGNTAASVVFNWMPGEEPGEEL